MNSPMAYEHTFGPAIDPVTRLGWGLGLISIFVILTIGALLLGGILRKRAARSLADPRQLTARRDAGGLAWIYVGGGVSTVVLIGCMVWTMVVTAAVSRPPGVAALTIEVTASQFWWSIRYQSADPARVFTTANEIHIPAGQPVRVELVSSDVIHSFWIPQLAGKMDVIPGQTNVSWLQANQPGTYRGQCAAFCGAQHAHMALLVVADSVPAFAAWEEHQRLAASVVGDRGQQIFQTHCGVCHTIRGLTPAGIVGPDLTHLMTRGSLAAGLLLNTPGNLTAWIANPESLKPGVHMPAELLSGEELTALVRYLNTLN